MAETTEPYEVAIAGEIYREVHENNAGVRRICVHTPEGSYDPVGSEWGSS